MPLLPGRSHEIVSHNIKEMLAAGHPHDQAVAAALHNAGLSRTKKVKKAAAKPLQAMAQKSDASLPPQGS